MRTALVLVMLCLPAFLHAQDDVISAKLSVQGTAWNYGGFIFDLEVTNNSDKPITFFDPMDDAYVQFIDEKGKEYHSTYFNRLVGQPVDIMAGETYRTQFEIVSVGKTIVSDNSGYGPVYGVGKYRVFDTLHYIAQDPRDTIKHVLETNIQIPHIPDIEVEMVDEYHMKYIELMYYFFHSLDEELHDPLPHDDDFDMQFEYDRMLDFVGGCLRYSVHRRLLQSAIHFAVNYMNQVPYPALKLYLALYPETPFAKTYARPLVTADIPEWLLHKTQNRYVDAYADEVFQRAYEIGQQSATEDGK